MVHSEFPQAFEESANQKDKRLLMDGCPRQNSKVAVKAIEQVGGVIFSIPPRSPDINPIENFFHLINNCLRQEAIEKKIKRESFEEFSDMVEKLCFQHFCCRYWQNNWQHGKKDWSRNISKGVKELSTSRFINSVYIYLIVSCYYIQGSLI